LDELHLGRTKLLNPCLKLARFCHFEQYPSVNSSNSALVKLPQSKIGIFWDLENKPPNSVSPFEAAIKLKRAVSSFGIVRYMVAYANQHAFSYVPSAVRELRNERKVLNRLENKGVIRCIEPYVCRVCGRKFRMNEKLIEHFKVHEREHQKRLKQIESAKGKKRVNLVGKYAMKMEKYKNAAREILTPKVGYGLGDDLKRAGFWVRMVSDEPQAADVALKSHIVDMMDHRRIECLVIVSDDSDFLGVLKEAKERCLKTVVVGDNHDGVLKRNADASFSWRDILVGKAKTQAVSVVGQWKDRDVLKRLEWSYNPDLERGACKGSNAYDFENVQLEEEDTDDSIEDDHDPLLHNDDRPWWELDPVDDGASSNPLT
ncbi:uncharacterized protein LOC110719748, partial [Chenopodium quinoa]|uniref:uncharacterized protein LOC110719748 n=1 Tax=Chenopodium quinoa TaxID=63459 RepID=UPI000B799682